MKPQVERGGAVNMAVNIPEEVVTETPEWKGSSNDATNSIEELVTRSATLRRLQKA